MNEPGHREVSGEKGTAAPRAPLRLLLLEEDDVRLPRAAELLGGSREEHFETMRARADDMLAATLAEAHCDVLLVETADTAGAVRGVFARIRALAPELPIVLLADSPCADEAPCLEAVRAGAQDVLIKSEVSPVVLARALRYAIERQRAKVEYADLLAEAERARERAVRAKQRAAFAASATTALIASLDFESTLRTVAEQAVRGLADFCIIDLVEEDGAARRVVVTHADPARQSIAEQLLPHAIDRNRPHPMAEALRTRAPVLIPEVGAEYLATIAQDAQHLAALQQLEARSLIALPLLARERLLGAMLLVRAKGRPPFDADDLTTAEELADRAALAIDNARLYAEARDAIAARNSVLRIVAHDLRNPLNAIRMTADLLLDSSPTPEELVRRAELVRRGAEQMDHLIQDLLDVARLDAGQLALDRAPVAPERLVRQAVELNAPLAAARALDLTSDLPPTALPPVDVDAQRILQVLGNLIDNAIKFTPKGGKIEVSVTGGASEVGFTVRDSGIGMSEDDLGHLFRPFWQVRRGGRAGAGLGLAISKAIVEAHGGRISAESTPGQGSSFRIVLPSAEERRQDG
jgi:signal transduction histidine kinase/DNA-binding NarL/FixJ family response regulator